MSGSGLADLTTRYLGLPLPNPFVVGASPLSDDLDGVRRLEDAGAAAIVMSSLFEEQITRETFGTLHRLQVKDAQSPAVSYYPSSEELACKPDAYLEHIRRVKRAVGIPIIGSLNGTTDHGWTWYARMIEEAGADALELNVYQLSTNLWESGEVLERELVRIVQSAKRVVRIPVAVKLSPYFTSLVEVARRLDDVDVDGLVLFNRFYQPDVDPELLRVVPRLTLSDSSELLLRLRWIAVLSGRVQASLAVGGGIHTVLDAVKALIVGADALQVVSALLQHGPEHLVTLREGLGRWLVERDYASVAQLRGRMNLAECQESGAFERANYLRVLVSRSFDGPAERSR